MLVTRSTRSVVLGLALFLACGALAETGWYLPGLSRSVGFHGGIGLVLVAVGYAARRRAREALWVLLASSFALGPWIGADRAPRAAPPSSQSMPGPVVLIANPFYWPARSEALTRAIDAADADLVALLEPPASLPAVLEQTGRWHTVASHLPGGKESIALMARATVLAPMGPLAVERAEIVAHDYTPSRVLRVQARWAGRPMIVVAAHPPPPLVPWSHAVRKRLVPRLADLAGTSTPAVILGDLNATIADPLIAHLEARGFRRAPQTRFATWPTPLGPLGITIDHILVTSGLRVAPASRVRLPGSDHFGVRAQLAWPDHRDGRPVLP